MPAGQLIIGLRVGYGFISAPDRSYGSGIDAFNNEFSSDGQMYGFNSAVLAQYSINENSALVLNGSIATSRQPMKPTDYYGSRTYRSEEFSISCTRVEGDLLYSYRFSDTVTLFGGCKLVQLRSKSSFPVDEELSEAVVTDFEYVLQGAGPGAGVSINRPFFNDVFVQVKFSAGRILYEESIDTNISTEFSRDAMMLYGFSSGFGWYYSRYHTSLHVGFQNQIYVFGFNPLVDEFFGQSGLYAGANYIFIP